MPWINEVGQFLWAVINNWAGYSTGGIIVAVVALWHLMKSQPIPRKLGLGLAAFFFFLSFFKAWQDQYHRANEAELKAKILPAFQITVPPITVPPAQVVIAPANKTPKPHPIISAAWTTVSKDATRRRVDFTVALRNSTQYAATATVREQIFWNGNLLKPEQPARKMAFPPQLLLQVQELSSYANLSQDDYQSFLNGTGTLVVKVLAEYDDMQKKTIYVMEGEANPDSDHLNMLSSDWKHTN